MRNPQGRPTIGSTLADPIINRHKVKPGLTLVPQEKSYEDKIAARTVEILIEELAVAIEAHKVTSPEEVLGVLLIVQRRYEQASSV